MKKANQLSEHEKHDQAIKLIDQTLVRIRQTDGEQSLAAAKFYAAKGLFMMRKKDLPGMRDA